MKPNKINDIQLILEFGSKLLPIFDDYWYSNLWSKLLEIEIRENIYIPPIKLKSNNNLKEKEYRFLLNRNVVLTKCVSRNVIVDKIISDIMKIVNTDFEKLLKSKDNLKTIDSWINDICLFIVSKQELSVGIKYIHNESEAPILLSRQYKCPNIVSIARRNKIPLIYRKRLAWTIYCETNINNIVDQQYWMVFAKIFKRLAKKNANFNIKTKINI